MTEPASPIPATAPAIGRSQREEIAVRRIETVTGEFMTEPGEPFWRIVINGYCADFDHEQAANNFAAQINALQQTRAEIVEECARVAEVEAADFAALQRGRKDLYRMGQKDGCIFAAAAIRALATETDANDGARAAPIDPAPPQA